MSWGGELPSVVDLGVGGKRRATPSYSNFFSFPCSFRQKSCKIIPPPRGNHASATASEPVLNLRKIESLFPLEGERKKTTWQYYESVTNCFNLKFTPYMAKPARPVGPFALRPNLSHRTRFIRNLQTQRRN